MAIRGPYIIPRLGWFYWHVRGVIELGRQNWRQNFPGALMRYNRPPKPKRRKSR